VDDSAVLPFVGPDTFLVGRLDVDRVDADAVERYATELAEQVAKAMGQDSPESLEQLKAEMAEPMRRMREGLAEFVKAGGRQVYFVMDPEDLGQALPLTVTPLAPGADADKLEELLTEAAGVGTVTSRVGQVLVTGVDGRVEGLKERAPDAAGGKPEAGGERPDLAKAFAAAGDAPLRLAFLPGEMFRAEFEADEPTLPEELGGGDVKTVSRGLRWAAAGVTQKPSIAMNVTVRAADAERAKALEGVLAKAIELAKGQVEPGSDVAKQLGALKPRPQGQTITFRVDAGVVQMLMFGGLRAEVLVDDDDDDAINKAPPAKPDKPAAPAKPDKPDKGGL
jgi:hypothetical protein